MSKLSPVMRLVLIVAGLASVAIFFAHAQRQRTASAAARAAALPRGQQASLFQAGSFGK